MYFPDIYDKDLSEKGKENETVKMALDYAVTQYESRNARRRRLEKLYDSFNGIIDKAEIEAITKQTGKLSKTKYIKYRIGGTKLKQLHGEFLEINQTPTVTTINRSAVNAKMDKYKSQLGLAISKPYINQARQMGYDVFPGMQIPDINNKDNWSINNFKLENEIAMQAILEEKMLDERLKTKFSFNFVDLTIAAEVFGKVERDHNGRDTYRPINPKFALFEESVNDPFCTRTPYFGEVRMMYIHEILESREFKLDDDQKKQLKNYYSGSYSNESDGPSEMSDGVTVVPVYTIQIKGIEPVYTKVSDTEGSDIPYRRTISNEYYRQNRKRLEKQDAEYYEATGRHMIEVVEREILWTATRIGKDIYIPAEKETDLIQILNNNGIYNVQFDYSGMLFNTVNGTRVSVQEIIYELERIYDDIRFMMNRELKKIKGDTIAYDDAFLPKGKKFIDIKHEIDEDGVVHFDSSAEGNRSGLELESNKVGLQVLNLGNNQNLMILLQNAMDIERVLDKITGMNENRQGLSKATTTATANTNNIEASRSMTYSLFYFMSDYMERVLAKLCEKTKLNAVYRGDDYRQFIYDGDTIKYMIATKDLINDNYGVSITDGKREKDILYKLESYFPAEINAGEIRTKDVAKFYMETNFAAAIKILDKAQKEMEQFKLEQERVKQESSNNQIQATMQMQKEDREDRQQHDLEMEEKRTEGKLAVEKLRQGMQATINYQNNVAKAVNEQQKSSNIFEQ